MTTDNDPAGGAKVMVPRDEPDAKTEERINAEWCALFGSGPDSFENPGVIHYDEFRSALIAATQQSPISGEGWQDISTAPKDGTRVIGFTKFGVEVVKWHEWDGAEYGSRTGWIGVEQDSTCYPESYLRAVATYQPTHWRPLPAPPVPSVSGGEDQGSSLRDTQLGSADGSSSNEGAGT